MVLKVSTATGTV